MNVLNEDSKKMNHVKFMDAQFAGMVLATG
jgi:hypothetical protein